MEQKLLTLPEYLSLPPVFSGVCVTRSSVLCVCFVDCCLSFCPFSVDHYVVCPFVLFLWTILLSVPLSFFCGPFCCLSLCPFSVDHSVVCPFVLFLWTIMLSVPLSFFCGSFCCLSLCPFSVDHSVVCPSSIYGF